MTVQYVICTQGLSLIFVVLFSIYTEIETLFSFISMINMITVCDRRYLEKPIHIVCWTCMSLIQWGKGFFFFFFFWPRILIAYMTIQKVQSSNRKALCFSSTFRWGGSHGVNRPIILWTSLISSVQRSVCRDQWWTACNYKASLESIVR